MKKCDGVANAEIKDNENDFNNSNKKYNIVTDSNSENNFNGTECHSDNNNENG